jgi:hypothetical protein
MSVYHVFIISNIIGLYQIEETPRRIEVVIKIKKAGLCGTDLRLMGFAYLRRDTFGAAMECQSSFRVFGGFQAMFYEFRYSAHEVLG